jgi:hypothetical protein
MFETGRTHVKSVERQGCEIKLKHETSPIFLVECGLNYPTIPSSEGILSNISPGFYIGIGIWSYAYPYLK